MENEEIIKSVEHNNNKMGNAMGKVEVKAGYPSLVPRHR